MLLHMYVIFTSRYCFLSKCAQYDPSCRRALKHYSFIHSFIIAAILNLVSAGASNLDKAKVCMFNPFPNKPLFLCVCSTSLLKTLWKKKKLLIMSKFSFSHSVFDLFRELSAIFNKFEIVICNLFKFGRV